MIKTVEEVREYIQKDYWEEGKSKGISGYEANKIDWHWNRRLVDALEQAFSFQGKKILDLGCAYGQVVASMIERGYDAYGIDLSDYAIAQGKKLYPPMASRIIQGSVHELTAYSKDKFDFLYSQQVFEHVPADVCISLAQETFRVAKPGCILWVGLVLDLNSDFQPEGHNPKDPDKTHINLRPKVWWDRIFTETGWELCPKFDNKFRQHKLSDGYSFFGEYGWHSICYKKLL